MSVRNIDKGFIKLNDFKTTTLTIPLTFTGPFTAIVDATFKKVGRLVTLTIPPVLGIGTSSTFFTANVPGGIPADMLPHPKHDGGILMQWTKRYNGTSIGRQIGDIEIKGNEQIINVLGGLGPTSVFYSYASDTQGWENTIKISYFTL